MHFQIPPQDHTKLVYVPHGAVTDVVLDLRKGSPTFGGHIAVELSAENHMMLYIPVGCAHGFISREDGTRVVYLQSTMRSAEHEAGIRFDSFGMDWGVNDPIVSKRDQVFQTLGEFDSPFTFQK
jgi:dTDP-4-dehydrorhamnose 3,5-epimerase